MVPVLAFKQLQGGYFRLLTLLWYKTMGNNLSLSQFIDSQIKHSTQLIYAGWSMLSLVKNHYNTKINLLNTLCIVSSFCKRTFITEKAQHSFSASLILFSGGPLGAKQRCLFHFNEQQSPFNEVVNSRCTQCFSIHSYQLNQDSLSIEVQGIWWTGE